jgi:aryl-alcohol dehydrogenase-like predicted oxidoreductase
MLQTYDIALVPWAPSAGGFFSERYRRDHEAPEGSRYEAFWRGFYRESFEQKKQVFDLQEAVLEMAAERNVSGYAFALAWCLARPGVTSPIIGPRTSEQLVDALSALSIVLTGNDIRRLDQLAPPEAVSVPYIEYKGKHLFRP